MMRAIAFFCLAVSISCLSCVSTKTSFNPKHVLWFDEMARLDACENYEQFQAVATSLRFSLRSDEKKNAIRILTYTRNIYVPKTRNTGTQVLGFWINLYVPNVTFATPHTIYPFYNMDFKRAAEKKGFKLLSGTDSDFSMFRLSDQATFYMTEKYDPQKGLSIYTLSF